MSIILSDLRTQIRLTVQSTADWPDGALDAWIADAIRLYSAQFPRRWRHTLTLQDDEEYYPLPADLQSIISVECPVGSSPRRFLTPAAEWSTQFLAGNAVYALRGSVDELAEEAPEPDLTVPGYIVFAQPTTEGQSAIIEYWGCHAIPTAEDDEAIITVPPQHLEAIVAFVEFRAHWELETDTAYTADSVAIVLSQLGENARRAWNRYKEVMSQLEYLNFQPLTSPNPVWNY